MIFFTLIRGKRGKKGERELVYLKNGKGGNSHRNYVACREESTCGPNFFSPGIQSGYLTSCEGGGEEEGVSRTSIIYNGREERSFPNGSGLIVG